MNFVSFMEAAHKELPPATDHSSCMRACYPRYLLDRKVAYPAEMLLTTSPIDHSAITHFRILPSGESSSIERQSPKYISCRLMRLAQTPIQF